MKERNGGKGMTDEQVVRSALHLMRPFRMAHALLQLR